MSTQPLDPEPSARPRDGGGVTPAPPSQPGHDADVPGTRRCGRCRTTFDGDPALMFQTDWELCPACEAILLPGRAGRRTTS